MSTEGATVTAASLHVTSAVQSHPGPVRAVNEDAFLQAPDIGLWVVADGMGGHEGGRLASRTVIDCLDSDPDLSSEARFVQDIVDRLDDANNRIQAIAHERFGGRAIGSTVVVLLLYRRRAICLWAGDSRLYLYRGGVLRQVTRDHSHVADLVARGLLHPDEVSSHPLRNVITRAVGARTWLEIERCDVDVRAGDRFLLCTDGLNKVLSDDDIRAILNRGACERVVTDLIRTALARAATDNVTVCLVCASDPPATGDSRPEAAAGKRPDGDDPTVPLDWTTKPG